MKTARVSTLDGLAVLHGSIASPYVRKVRIALAVKRIPYEWSRDYYGFLQELNPLAKVPVFVTPDGESFFDSRVICEYLEMLQPEPPLLPQDMAARLAVKRWEALADGICDAVVAIVNERARKLADEASRPWYEHQQGKVERASAWAAHQLEGREWCCHDQLSLADAALFSALRYTSLRLPTLQWKHAHPNLARYCDALEQLEAFFSTNTEAVAA